MTTAASSCITPVRRDNNHSTTTTPMANTATSASASASSPNNNYNTTNAIVKRTPPARRFTQYRHLHRQALRQDRLCRARRRQQQMMMFVDAVPSLHAENDDTTLPEALCMPRFDRSSSNSQGYPQHPFAPRKVLQPRPDRNLFYQPQESSACFLTSSSSLTDQFAAEAAAAGVVAAPLDAAAAEAPAAAPIMEPWMDAENNSPIVVYATPKPDRHKTIDQQTPQSPSSAATTTFCDLSNLTLQQQQHNNSSMDKVLQPEGNPTAGSSSPLRRH